MSGDESRAVVHVDRFEATGGGVGVQVRVDAGPVRRRSTVKSTAGEPPLTGRDHELAAIASSLDNHRVVIVHGAPGLGKSRLAKEYALRNAASYPGGMYFVPFEKSPPTELAKLLRGTNHPAYADESVDEQCRRALQDVGSTGRALVIYDAILDEETLRDWLPYDGLDWHLLATSTSASWSRAWSVLDLAPLLPDAAMALVAAILCDDAAAQQLIAPIAAKASGLTIELCASAAAAHERLRRGRSVEGISAELGRETSSSFESAWDLLSEHAKVALQAIATFAVPRIATSLVATALERLGWDAHAVESAIDAAADRKLITVDRDTVEMHRLIAQFVRGRAPLGPALRHALFVGLIATAEAFVERPGDVDLRAQMIGHRLELADWAELVDDDRHAELLGRASGELGQFKASLDWLERAVAAAAGCEDRSRLGKSLHMLAITHGNLGNFEAALDCAIRSVDATDVDAVEAGVQISRLNHAGFCQIGLGRRADAMTWFQRALDIAEQVEDRDNNRQLWLAGVLYHIGGCHSHFGRFEQARLCLERAVAAAECTDDQRRVDHVVLGSALHALAVCCEHLGRFEESLGYLSRAVAAAEHGDKHGRVNPMRIGTVMHRAGSCHERLGRFDEACRWFERAVAAKERGDKFGRVMPLAVGMSLHRVGYCRKRLGQIEPALASFERAVAAKQRGDLFGRVDHDLVGVSLYELGACHELLGNFDEARRQLAAAIAAHERGDVHGKVDFDTLGTSLHQMGSCHEHLARFEEARAWFERAIAAKQKGNLVGIIDHHSLGLSLHRLAGCDEHFGQIGDALANFERAVERFEQGDTFSRVHYDELGASSYRAGCCAEQLRGFAIAAGWFERATVALARGDVLGRVDEHAVELSNGALRRCRARLGE